MFENKLKIIQGSLSLGEFAKKLEVPKTTVHQYLNGRSFPFEFAVLVCERFGYSLEWLAGSNNSVAEPQHPYGSGLISQAEETLLRRIRRLDENHRENILEMIEAYECLSEGKQRVLSGSAVSGSQAINFKRRSTD